MSNQLEIAIKTAKFAYPMPWRVHGVPGNWYIADAGGMPMFTVIDPDVNGPEVYYALQTMVAAVNRLHAGEGDE